MTQTSGRVPLFDLSRQTAALRPELLAALARVVDDGRYILGPEVESFEREVAGYLGAAHAVALASGTDALALALRAAGVGPGDLVLTTPFTFFATASAILAVGATPVFADVDPATFNLDPSAASAAVDAARGRVRAIVPVHLFGQAADTAALADLAARHGAVLVEDAAQAFGAEEGGRPVGARAAFACFSFFPTKNLGGMGDGGLVTTSDAGAADRLRLLRAHGARRRYLHEMVGTNSRLDALQAAVLRVKLGHVEEWLAARRRHAAAYDRALATLEGIVPPHVAPGRAHAFHQYTLRIPGGRRDAAIAFLDGEGVQSRVYYRVPLHLQPALGHLGHRRGDFPEAERAADEVLSIPMFPELRPDEAQRVVEALAAWAGTA